MASPCFLSTLQINNVYPYIPQHPWTRNLHRVDVEIYFPFKLWVVTVATPFGNTMFFDQQIGCSYIYETHDYLNIMDIQVWDIWQFRCNWTVIPWSKWICLWCILYYMLYVYIIALSKYYFMIWWCYYITILLYAYIAHCVYIYYILYIKFMVYIHMFCIIS